MMKMKAPVPRPRRRKTAEKQEDRQEKGTMIDFQRQAKVIDCTDDMIVFHCKFRKMKLETDGRDPVVKTEVEAIAEKQENLSKEKEPPADDRKKTPADCDFVKLDLNKGPGLETIKEESGTPCNDDLKDEMIEIKLKDAAVGGQDDDDASSYSSSQSDVYLDTVDSLIANEIQGTTAYVELNETVMLQRIQIETLAQKMEQLESRLQEKEAGNIKDSDLMSVLRQREVETKVLMEKRELLAKLRASAVSSNGSGDKKDCEEPCDNDPSATSAGGASATNLEMEKRANPKINWDWQSMGIEVMIKEALSEPELNFKVGTGQIINVFDDTCDVYFLGAENHQIIFDVQRDLLVPTMPKSGDQVKFISCKGIRKLGMLRKTFNDGDGIVDVNGDYQIVPLRYLAKYDPEFLSEEKAKKIFNMLKEQSVGKSLMNRTKNTPPPQAPAPPPQTPAPPPPLKKRRRRIGNFCSSLICFF